VKCGVGEHRQHVEQEARVGVGQLWPGCKLDWRGASSQQTWGGGRRSSPPPSSPSSPASVVVAVAVVVLVPRPVSTHVRALLLLLLLLLLLMMMMVVVVVVVIVKMNISLFCLYVKVRWRGNMMGSLDGVEGRLVVQLVRGMMEEAGPGLCQQPSGISGVKVDISHSASGRSVEMSGEGGRQRARPPAWELEQVRRVRS